MLAIHTYTERSSQGGTVRTTHCLAPVRAITLWCSANAVNRSALTTTAVAMPSPVSAAAPGPKRMP